MPLSVACQERCRMLKLRQHMIDRCCKPEHPCFAYYGGRGITVCDRWLKSPQAFIDDIGPRPVGMTMDRIDNDRGYGPDNFRWATRAEQVRNRRNSIWVEIDGRRMVLKDACAHLGKRYDSVWVRVKHGMPIAQALTMPAKKRALSPSMAAHIRSQIAAGNRQCEIARALGVSQAAVSDVALGKTYVNH